jgi:NADH/NAD ratio-sensing transcriptional regulator Rex
MKELAILVLGVVVAVLTIASTQVIGQKMSDLDVKQMQEIEQRIAKERMQEQANATPIKYHLRSR